MKSRTDGICRVAHVAEAFEIGGLEKLLVEFAKHADRARFEPVFVALGARGALAEELESHGGRVLALGAPSGRRPRLIFRLARLFRRERIDVVHTHSSGPLLYATPAARLAGAARVIHTRHHGKDPFTSPRALAACRLVSRWIDRIVCVSKEGVELGVAEGFDPRKLGTIWNGIDPTRFPPTGPAAGGPAVLVARLSPEKDVASLLRATALVAREEPAFRLDVAGDGVCLSDLKALAHELGVGERARFLGRVHDVPALLARASLMVLPSLMEGISLTLLEGMAQGLPIVATRVGGNPEVVVEGETGLLVPPRAPDELAAAILRIHRDPALGQRLGAAGRSRVETVFDARRMVADYENIYKNKEF